MHGIDALGEVGLPEHRGNKKTASQNWHHDPQSPESKTMRNGFLEFIKGLVCDNLLLQSK